VRANDRQDPTVSPVKSAVASSPIEQDEPLVSQQCFDLAEANAGKRGLHLLQ
jgi:hypothetical protein